MLSSQPRRFTHMIATYVSTALIACFALAGTPAWAADAAPSGAKPDGTRAVGTLVTPARDAAAKLNGFAPAPELGSVHFDFDKAAIRPSEARILDKHAEWLKSNSGVMLAIDAGADPRGSVVYNKRLSERRAQAVKDYLVERGVAADRIVNAASGEGLPTCREAGEACWQKNRRADFLVKVADKQSP
jgi:outer membrane protein OmpA-like peptidoglycan-associated protein